MAASKFLLVEEFARHRIDDIDSAVPEVAD